MKRNRMKLILPLLCLALALLLTGCGAKMQLADRLERVPSAEPVAEADFGAGGMARALEGQGRDTETALEEKASESEPPGPVSTAGRKLIKDVKANVETMRFEQYVAAIEAKCAALGGHIASKETSDGGYSPFGRDDDTYRVNRHAAMVLRIPAAKLAEFQAALAVDGRVTNLNESVRDVTMEYTDVAAHIKALQAERDALTKMLGQANATEELLQIREQLTKTRYELDALEGQMRVLEDQIALSTVTLAIQEVKRETPTKELGFWAGAWAMFTDNLWNVGRGLRNFFQGFLGAIPYLVLLAILCVVPVLLILRAKRRGRKKP